jgi:protein-S-isoprenylcysteine O-methyltransferase Ste14
MLRLVFLLALQLVPCVLLVLFGWGFENLHTFLADPARAGLTAVTLAAVFIAAILRLNIDPLRRGRSAIERQAQQLAVLLILSLILLWFLPFADRRKILTLSHEYWRYLGLLMYAVGAGVRIFALHALGEYFSAYVTLQPDHRLIRHGIYSSIRHPLYLSLLLAPTGFALVFASKLALPILILAVLFVLDRIWREEDLLAAHFGLEFAAYRRCTWKLLPHMF